MDEDDALLAQRGNTAYDSDDSFEEKFGKKKYSENQLKK